MPAGVVLTVDARRVVADDQRLTMAASAAVERLGDVPVAVRSSAIAEDLPGASFRGSV